MNDGIEFGLFDVLSLLRGAWHSGIGLLSRAELCTLTYFACVSSMFGGEAAVDWGYQFVRTPSAGITTETVVLALESLGNGELVGAHNAGFTLTQRGREYSLRLSKHAVFRKRVPYLDAVSGVLAFLGPGLIKASLDYEPSVRASVLFDRTDVLLEGPPSRVLYRQLQSMRELLPGELQPFVSSATYIDYLQRVARAADE
jgi:hypothetical protein